MAGLAELKIDLTHQNSLQILHDFPEFPSFPDEVAPSHFVAHRVNLAVANDLHRTEVDSALPAP